MLSSIFCLEYFLYSIPIKDFLNLLIPFRRPYLLYYNLECANKANVILLIGHKYEFFKPNLRKV